MIYVYISIHICLIIDICTYLRTIQQYRLQLEKNAIHTIYIILYVWGPNVVGFWRKETMCCFCRLQGLPGSFQWCFQSSQCQTTRDPTCDLRFCVKYLFGKTMEDQDNLSSGCWMGMFNICDNRQLLMRSTQIGKPSDDFNNFRIIIGNLADSCHQSVFHLVLSEIGYPSLPSRRTWLSTLLSEANLR